MHKNAEMPTLILLMYNLDPHIYGLSLFVVGVFYRYLEHGGLPLVAPYNESYPADFFLGRSHLHHETITTNNLSHPLIVTNPVPGPWYVAAFLPKGTTSKITQAVSQFENEEIRLNMIIKK